MNENFYFRVIKNWLKSSFVLHTRELKEDNGKLKQNAKQYGVREGSPVGVQLILKPRSDRARRRASTRSVWTGLKAENQRSSSTVDHKVSKVYVRHLSLSYKSWTKWRKWFEFGNQVDEVVHVK